MTEEYALRLDKPLLFSKRLKRQAGPRLLSAYASAEEPRPPVPFSSVRSVEVWHLGDWRDVDGLPAEEVDAALGA